MNMTSCPLLELILSQVRNNEYPINSLVIEKIRFIMSERIRGKIGVDECKNLLDPLLKNHHPREWLEMILSTNDIPIPIQGNDDPKEKGIRKKTRSWTTYEDQRLVAGIHKYGLENWGKISCFVGSGRTRAQCVQRWKRGLNPNISKDHWTPLEEEKLIVLVKERGLNGWTSISHELGSRTDVQCRYHYIQMKKENRVPEDYDESVLLPTARSLKDLQKVAKPVEKGSLSQSNTQNKISTIFKDVTLDIFLDVFSQEESENPSDFFYKHVSSNGNIQVGVFNMSKDL